MVALSRKERRESHIRWSESRETSIIQPSEFRNTQIGRLSWLDGTTYCYYREKETNETPKNTRKRYINKKNYYKLVNMTKIRTLKPPRILYMSRGFIIVYEFFLFLLLLD